VELKRIELLTPCLQSRCSPKLSYSPRKTQLKLKLFGAMNTTQVPHRKKWWAQVELNH
jgi:hypothetical protein